jgi:hypothetical protein
MAASSQAGWSVLQRSYRQLRVYGETPAFLRHCVSVHTPKVCAASAAAMLHAHRKLASIAQQRAEVGFFRIDRKLQLWAARRRVRAHLHMQRSRMQVLNLVSDVFVLLTMGLMLWVVAGSFNLVRVALHRLHMMENMEHMAAALLETTDALENVGREREEAGRAQ